MEPDNIRRLIDKYYTGETSLEEEIRLRELLNSEEGLPELENEQDIFSSLEQQRNESDPPEELEAELTEMINKKWMSTVRNRFRTSLKWSLAAAAGLAIILISYQQLNRTTPENIPSPTREEQEAFSKTKQVLTYLSGTMNAECSKLDRLNTINKGFASLNDLNIIDQSINTYKTEEK